MARTGEAPDENDAMERLAPLAGVHEYPSRVKCATLAWHALLSALNGNGGATSE
jgi:nitrogen fixation NifU-like protein